MKQDALTYFTDNHAVGMTLRDYFAAKALSGLLASEVNAPMGSFVSRAYKLADLMLEERDKV